MRKVLSSIVLTVALSGAVLAPAARAAEGLAPPGYRVTHAEELRPGLSHFTLRRSRTPRVVNVARLSAGSSLVLRSVVAAETAPRTERTSAICRRARCLVAVNGDFFSASTGQPTGGVVTSGELVRSPNDRHHQLMLDTHGRPSAGRLAWRGTLVPTDLQSTAITGVNVTRAANATVLYTPSFGASTATNRHGNELVMRVVQPSGALRLGQTALVRFEELRSGQEDAPIPRDGAVLSGHGRGEKALATLWARVRAGTAAREALLRIEASGGVLESVGGTPILVRDGKRWFADTARSFVRDRHPRTMVGWNRAGDVFLVTVDGRQRGYSQGMTLAEAADFMIRLGATDAINLDGGGSTTFVERGVVANRPSDRAVRRAGRTVIAPAPRRGDRVLGNVERPVANALVVVPRDATDHPAVNPLGSGLGLPEVVEQQAPVESDPASNPGVALPAIIAVVEGPDRRPAILAGAAVAGLSTGLVWAFKRRRRRAAA